jgi:hypothetical protein
MNIFIHFNKTKDLLTIVCTVHWILENSNTDIPVRESEKMWTIGGSDSPIIQTVSVTERSNHVFTHSIKIWSVYDVVSLLKYGGLFLISTTFPGHLPHDIAVIIS